VKGAEAAASDGAQTKVQSVSQAHEDTVMKVPAIKLVEVEPLCPRRTRLRPCFPAESIAKGTVELDSWPRNGSSRAAGPFAGRRVAEGSASAEPNHIASEG